MLSRPQGWGASVVRRHTRHHDDGEDRRRRHAGRRGRVHAFEVQAQQRDHLGVVEITEPNVHADGLPNFGAGASRSMPDAPDGGMAEWRNGGVSAGLGVPAERILEEQFNDSGSRAPTLILGVSAGLSRFTLASEAERPGIPPAPLLLHAI